MVLKKYDQLNHIINFRSHCSIMIIINIKKFNLFKIHYLVQLIIIIVSMENKIQIPT